MSGEQNRGTPPQNPDEQWVPKHRFDQVNGRLKDIESKFERMQALYDQQVQSQNRGQVDDDSPFDANVTKALEAMFEKKIQPYVSQFQNSVGHVYDEAQRVDFIQRYGVDTYDKYAEDIKGLRDSRSKQGQFLSWEDAYKFVYYDQTGKKPKENPMPPQKPEFDPYTGQFKEPGEPAKPQEQQVQPQGQPQVPPQRVPPQPQQPPQQMQPQEPPGFEMDLPPAGTADGHGMPMPSHGGNRVDIGMSNEQLEDWASRYGDQPL